MCANMIKHKHSVKNVMLAQLKQPVNTTRVINKVHKCCEGSL